MNKKPRIVVILPRGEAIRNFVHSGIIRRLSEDTDIYLLSVVDDSSLRDDCKNYIKEFIVLNEYPRGIFNRYLRMILENAHERWVWSVRHRYSFWHRMIRAKREGKYISRLLTVWLSRALAHNRVLRWMTAVENTLHKRDEGNKEFRELFREIDPSLVVVGSHIHGFAAELPAKIAGDMGIPVAGFVFSWDNLTTRSRICVSYDYYFVWNNYMKGLLLNQYPHVPEDNIFVTGTPQLDFHFKPEYKLDRNELCAYLGIDPDRPYILYTTGMASDFPEEHRTVEALAQWLENTVIVPKPQLVVRTYVKGTTDEMYAIRDKGYPDVHFMKVLWKKEWFTPMAEDIPIYCSLLSHCACGVNAASTVSLELMLYDKPVINLGFDPPGSDLHESFHFSQHIAYDHFAQVARSGATMVAGSMEELTEMVVSSLVEPELLREKRQAFLQSFFNGTLDGDAGDRIVERACSMLKT